MKKSIKKTVTTVTETIEKETNEKTLIISLLDTSGSMSDIIESARGGFNEFLNKQQKLEDEATMTIVIFDDKYDLLYNNVNLKDVKPLTDNEWSPRGMTALYDAIGKTINNVDSELNKSLFKKNRPDKVLVAIVTDGHENSSIEYNQQQIKDLIKKKEKDDWQFIYLAANQNAFDVGVSLGLHGGNTYTYTNTAQGNSIMFASLSNAAATYRGTSTKSADYVKVSTDLFAGDTTNQNVATDNQIKTEDFFIPVHNVDNKTTAKDKK